MEKRNLRVEFLRTIGETYDKYGYPDYCGWVEGLLLLEPQEWTQKGIAERLSDILQESKYPTSISSINRALKILESYGVIEKTGSRRIGYRYRLVSSSGLVASMLQQLTLVNQEFVKKMERLAVRNKKGDPDLERAIAYQISVAEVWNRAVEDLLAALTENSER